MYQVFVVEDELLIRQSVRRIVENMSGPYVCCGEASDGEMALSMMQDLMPDILLTDIRMPFLDGFELIRHVRSMMPWIRIIIISGFGDFESAQRAISLGANKYMLKPLRAPDLVAAIEEQARQIEREKSNSRMPEGYGDDELQGALRQHFMQQLLNGSPDTGALLERARRLKLEIVCPLYRVVLFSFEDLHEGQAELQHELASSLRELQLELYHQNEPDQLTLVICGNTEEQLNEETYRIISILRHRLKESARVITTVVSGSVNRVSRVSDACRKVREVLRGAGLLAAGQVIDAEDTSAVTADVLAVSGVFGDSFRKRLRECSRDDVDALLREQLDGPDASRFDSMLTRYYALADILRMLVGLQQRTAPDQDTAGMLEAYGKKYDLFAAAATRSAFEKTAGEILREIVSHREAETLPVRVPPVIARADAYVAAHFCDPGISLISVASEVGMSSAHFSTVFSQTHGTTFISYLTALRIDRARKLLRETDMKLAAIAMEIGYNEPNYFSYVFRKSEGITPKEYRQQHRNE